MSWVPSIRCEQNEEYTKCLLADQASERVKSGLASEVNILESEDIVLMWSKFVH